MGDLILPPSGGVRTAAFDEPSLAIIFLKRPSRGMDEPLLGHLAEGDDASRNAAKRALLSPTKRFHLSGSAHLKDAIMADNSAVCTEDFS